MSAPSPLAALYPPDFSASGGTYTPPQGRAGAAASPASLPPCLLPDESAWEFLKRVHSTPIRTGLGAFDSMVRSPRVRGVGVRAGSGRPFRVSICFGVVPAAGLTHPRTPLLCRCFHMTRCAGMLTPLSLLPLLPSLHRRMQVRCSPATCWR